MRFIILVGAILSLSGVVGANATSYRPSLSMRCLLEYEGEWRGEPVRGPGLSMVKATARFSHSYRIFTIELHSSDGMNEFYRSVRIANQRSGECHVVLDEGGRSSYFKGPPDPGSKVSVFKALFPDLQQPKYLVVDFSPCPDDPPAFHAANEDPRLGESK